MRYPFQLFKETEKITDEDIDKLKTFIRSVKPLNPQIKTEIYIVLELDTTANVAEKILNL